MTQVQRSGVTKRSICPRLYPVVRSTLRGTTPQFTLPGFPRWSDSSKPLGMSFAKDGGGSLLDKGSSWLLVWPQLALLPVQDSAQPCCLCGVQILDGSPLTGSPEFTLFRCVDSNLKPISEAAGNKRSHHGTGMSRVSLPWFVRLWVFLLTLPSSREWGQWDGGCAGWY